MFQKFASLGRAEWELANTTLVALRREDLEQLRVRGVAYTRELAARFRDAVLVVPLALDSLISEVSKSLFTNVASRERMLCSLSSVVLEERHTFMLATFSTFIFVRARLSLLELTRAAARCICLTVFRNLAPWWEQEAQAPECEVSSWLVPSGVLDCLDGNDVVGVVVRSTYNPMSPLFESALGLIVFGAVPVLGFAALCALSVTALVRFDSRRAQKSAHRAPKSSHQGNHKSPLLRLVLVSNILIMGSLVVLFVTGGGGAGFLLPDNRRSYKMFNYTALGGSSAAVDILLALIVGSIIRSDALGTRPPASGMVCAAFLVVLDLSQAISLALVWPNEFVYLILLPGLLLMAELSSSSMLAWRCFSLQWQVWNVVGPDRHSPAAQRLLAFHRRVIRTGVRSARVCSQRSQYLTRFCRSSSQPPRRR